MASLTWVIKFVAYLFFIFVKKKKKKKNQQAKNM